MTDGIDYLLVAVIGAVVGGSELLERFTRDEPWRALRYGQSWVYIALNAGAGAFALLLVAGLGVSTTKSVDPEVVRWSRVIVAGFGAVIVLRSSAVLPGGDAARGPGAVLQRYLDAVVDKIDGKRALERQNSVDALAGELPYTAVRDELVPTVLRMYPKAPADRVNELNQAVSDADALSFSEALKARAVIQALIAFGETSTVERAVATVKSQSGA